MKISLTFRTFMSRYKSATKFVCYSYSKERKLR